MYTERKKLYEQLEKQRETKLLVFFTGDRRGMETQIHSEIISFFTHHLDTFPDDSRISLYLYSRGGDTLAGWSIANLIRQFCHNFEVIIPSKAHSTATLITLGANNILMTKQASMGPIDPSINTPLNPQIPGAPQNVRMPISVQAIAGYFDLAKEELQIKKQEHLKDIFLKLSDQVHPIALGNVYRARTQIQMLADKLLRMHMKGDDKINNIISALCSESGSHDYTINRKEALEELKLPVEIPDNGLYKLIKNIYIDVSSELELDNPFDPGIILGTNSTANYKCTRAIVESVTGGSHKYISEGTLTKSSVPTPAGPADSVLDQRTKERWSHEE